MPRDVSIALKTGCTSRTKLVCFFINIEETLQRWYTLHTWHFKLGKISYNDQFAQLLARAWIVALGEWCWWLL